MLFSVSWIFKLLLKRIGNKFFLLSYCFNTFTKPLPLTLWWCKRDFFCNLTLYLLIMLKAPWKIFENIRGILGFCSLFHMFTNLEHLQSHSRCAINHYKRKNSSFVFLDFARCRPSRNMENDHVGESQRRRKSLFADLIGSDTFFVLLTWCQECCFHFPPRSGWRYFRLGFDRLISPSSILSHSSIDKEKFNIFPSPKTASVEDVDEWPKGIFNFL